MGLSSVLSTAVTGLGAAETTIDVVGNNVANANTVGFKASDVVFATQFLQTLGLGSAPTPTRGGTNPRQTGLGTQVAAVTPNFNQGTIQISGSSTDFAIQGDGFFIVQGSQGEQLFTRNGIFDLNAFNQLTTATGERLLGYGVDDDFQIQETNLVPIEIPLGNRLVAQATSLVELAGNLSPTGDLATKAEIIQSAILGDASYTAPTAAPTSAIAAVPSATTTGTSANAGGGLTAGAYQYQVVFLDNNGLAVPTESMPSAAVTLTVNAGHNSMGLTGIPTAPLDSNGDPMYAGRRIYRTEVGGSTFRLLTTINDNTTTTFNDTVSDATLAGQPTLNTASLTGTYSYYVTFADSLVGGGGLANPAGIESRPTPVTSTINVNTGRIQLRDLPTDNNWTSRRIYRNRVGFPNEFELVAEIPNMLADQTFTDNVQDAAIVNNKKLDLDGPKATSSTLLTDLLRRRPDGSYQNMFQAGELDFDAHKGVGTVKPKISNRDLAIMSSSTVQDLMTFFNESLGIVPSPGPDLTNPVPVDASSASPGVSIANGQIRIVGNNGLFNAVQINNDDLRQASVGNIDLGFSSVQTAVGTGGVTTFQVVDSLGIKLDVRLTVTLEQRNDAQTVYRWFADSTDNSSLNSAATNVGTGLVRFDGNGRLITDTFSDNTSVSIRRDNLPSTSPLNFQLDFSQVTGLDTQSNTLAAPRTDGFPPGQLTGFIVAEDGRIRGVFDNGAQRDLGQVRLARFANPAGMEQRGQNAYAPGVNSGLPVEGNPGEQGIGTLIAGAVELSNTDIGKNLIDLILASTQYRGNTRVISAAQQLLEELLNLRR